MSHTTNQEDAHGSRPHAVETSPRRRPIGSPRDDAGGSRGTRSHVQRHYLDDVPYLLPKDSLEDQRLNYQHHALYRTLSNHSLAPLSSERVRTILDVGTGIWSFELRALFPHALVVGVDVSLVRPGAMDSVPHRRRRAR